MYETFVKPSKGTNFRCVCSQCYGENPPKKGRVLLQSEIDEMLSDVGTYLNKLGECHDCSRSITYPINVPWLNLWGQLLGSDPDDVEYVSPETPPPPVVDFSAMDDRAIALWLNNQPRHGWNIPLWQSIKLHGSLNEVIGYFDSSVRDPDIENHVGILQKFLESITGFYKQEFPAVFNHLDQGYYFKDTTLRLAMELSNNEPTEKN